MQIISIARSVTFMCIGGILFGTQHVGNMDLALLPVIDSINHNSSSLVSFLSFELFQMRYIHSLTTTANGTSISPWIQLSQQFAFWVLFLLCTFWMLFPLCTSWILYMVCTFWILFLLAHFECRSCFAHPTSACCCNCVSHNSCCHGCVANGGVMVDVWCVKPGCQTVHL